MSDSFLYVPRPSPTGSPSNVIVQAQAVFQILDHALRNNNAPSRVIGVLLGVRSDDGSEIEVRSSFAVPHSETNNQAAIDVDYLRSMYNLHRAAYSRDTIIGWYTTSSQLNNLSGLMHDFFSASEGLASQTPIHLTVSTYETIAAAATTTPAKPTSKPLPKDISVNTYVSSPVGLSHEKARGSLCFVPIPNEIRFSEIERAGLDSIAKARDDPSRSVSLVNDIQSLESTLVKVLDMLDRVSTYVNSVIEANKAGTPGAGSVAIGKFLHKNLALVPSISKENLEKLFNSHLQDVLMAVYLANTVKTQLQLSSRLTPIV